VIELATPKESIAMGALVARERIKSDDGFIFDDSLKFIDVPK
jgi:hypothetical protein